MKTVSFLNRKGGVGKTSTVHHLAASLAKRGLRTLLVDTDPQASLTQGLLSPQVAREIAPYESLAALFDEAGGLPIEEIIRPTEIPNVSLLVGSESMDPFNVPNPWEQEDTQFALRDALSEVADQYDIALIDCPPNVYLCAWSALLASDGVVIPTQAEDYGAQGLVSIRRTLNKAMKGMNPDLKILGYLVTMFNKKLSVHLSYESDLRAIYGEEVFSTMVPLATDFKEAVNLRKPIGIYKPKSASAKTIDALAEEMLSRLGMESVRRVA